MGSLPLCRAGPWGGPWYIVPSEVTAAYAKACYSDNIIAEPFSVNIRVGSTAASPYMWHGTRLPDLSDRIEALAGDDQIIPLLLSKLEKHPPELRSIFSAQHNVAEALLVHCHQ